MNCLFVFIYGPHPEDSGTQGLLLALFLGITPGGAWGILWGPENGIWVDYMQGKHLPCWTNPLQ